MELATPALVPQYGSRPNYLFVEYLGLAKEVGGTPVRDFWPHLRVTALLLSLLAFLILALCGPGTLGHRPANPATGTRSVRGIEAEEKVGSDVKAFLSRPATWRCPSTCG